MLEPIALALVAALWIGCVFTGLQLLTPPRSRRSGIAWCASFALVVTFGATHGPGFGFGWLRATGARSDALALAALAAAIPSVLATHVDTRIRRTTWAIVVATTAALGCSIVGTAALALGRSTRSWDFLAMIVGGVLLATIGVLALLRRGASPNARLVSGAVTLAGGFQVAASVLLLVAWNSLS